MCGLVSLFLLAAGNLASVYSPRAVDPNQGWRRGATARGQLLMLLLYPGDGHSGGAGVPGAVCV